MKVWFPYTKGASGTDVFTRRQAEVLQRRGISTEMTCFPASYEFAPFLLRSVPVPDGTHIIHANSWNGFAFERAGIPFVVTEQLGVSDPVGRSYKSLMQNLYHETLIRRFAKASFKRATAITAVSHFTASGITRAFGIHSVSVIPNWVSTKDFPFTEPTRRQTRRPFRLLFMGNPSKRKGADLFAPIMRELGPDFELRFTSGLRDLKFNDAAPNMIPLGRLTEDSQLQEAYHQCDALLFPSRFEGLPHAPLEAMACGKPVIAADSSSLAEVVEDRVTGILCPTDDVTAFVTACRKLADNPEMVLSYGRAARRRAEEHFSEEVVIPQYIDLYERLLNGRTPTQGCHD